MESICTIIIKGIVPMADIISGKSRFNGNKNPESKKVINISKTTQEDALDEEQIRKKVKKHRQKVLIIAAIAVVVIMIGIFVVVHIMDGITYDTYTISNSINRDDTASSQYVNFSDGYLRYSNDGAAYFDIEGNPIWNQTYSMQKPQVSICGKWVAIGDLNGSKIYVFDDSKSVATIDTSLSISQIEVAENGVVSAVLEDTDANYINLYNTDGSKIYSVKTTIAGDGYPIDISISEDATKLIASYLYVSGDCMKTNVVFYNFSDVGQNETERVVGGFNHYDSTIVPDVKFVNNTTAVAIGENVISIYKIKEYPSLSEEIKLDNTIERVFFDDSHMGLVLNNTESEDKYKLVVYDFSGSKVCESTFNTQYDDIKFDGKSIIMSNSTTISLMNLKGKRLADITVELPVENVLSAGIRGKYIMINSKYIQTIKMK